MDASGKEAVNGIRMTAFSESDGARSVVLKCGRIAIVDAFDFDAVSSRVWRFEQSHTTGYATTSIRGKNTQMHRLITGWTRSDAEHIDHRDGDGLNNRRENLRMATPQQNAWNRKLSIRNTSSQFKGVSFRKTGPWHVRVRSGSRCWCGSFAEEETAGRAYDVIAAKWFGEFARLNFPGELEASQVIVAVAFRRFRCKDRQAEDSMFKAAAQ